MLRWNVRLSSPSQGKFSVSQDVDVVTWWRVSLFTAGVALQLHTVMAVDITLLFKASVKTVKTRNKAIGVGFDSTKDEIFKRSRPKSGFSPKAKEVVSVSPKLTPANWASIASKPTSRLMTDKNSFTVGYTILWYVIEPKLNAWL